jgi:RNA polymerase sigma-70 factor, ECF subfamily
MSLMAINEPDLLTHTVQRAAAGDEYAFARIVAAHHDDMCRVAYVVCRDTELAQEAVQEAWTIGLRQLSKLRDPHSLRGWLVAIAANQARQVVRRTHRRSVREVELDAGDRGAEATFGDPAGRAADLDLRNALARLSPDDRALLALRYVAGLDSTELSRVTGLSPSGTRARLARLLTILRRELSDA